MQTHKMKLLEMPYTEIKEGRKNVEMRLFDEKRQGIAAGDEIIFTCDELGGEEVRAKVKATYVYKNFKSLAESFSARTLGFDGFSSEYIAEYMLAIYGKEKEEKYGAYAIELEIF